MNTPSSRRPKVRINGLAIFLAAMAVTVLAIAIGANVLFDRRWDDHPWATRAAVADTASSHPAPASAPVVPSATPSVSAAPSVPATPAVSPAPAESTATSGQAPSVPSGSAAASATATTKTASTVVPAAFSPPSESAMPDGEYGKVIRLGQQVFMRTGTFAAKYVGNDLTCANCHLDAGRKADSAPLWGSFIHYPAYRKKTGQVDTLASRIQGCFEFSMNGKAPPQDDPIMTALQTYAFWLAKGAPVGTAVAGTGYPKLKPPAQPADFARGEKVYAQNCAVCHGADGLGQQAGGQQVFPPLWGPRSFNWGAGMHQLGNAAGFIQANMPLSKGGSLTNQEAWDVAMFMNSHERPQDPRYAGTVAATRKKYHDSEDSLYGLTVNGHVLGSGR